MYLIGSHSMEDTDMRVISDGIIRAPVRWVLEHGPSNVFKHGHLLETSEGWDPDSTCDKVP